MDYNVNKIEWESHSFKIKTRKIIRLKVKCKMN